MMERSRDAEEKRSAGEKKHGYQVQTTSAAENDFKAKPNVEMF